VPPAFDPERLKAVVLDYGNTVIRFGPSQLARLDGAMVRLLEKRCGPLDREAYYRMRTADRMKPYRDKYRENILIDLYRQHIHALYGREADDALLQEMAALRFDRLVKIVKAPASVRDVLGQLREQHSLALLSNYPDGNAIRASLEENGLTEFFDAVVVSGDVGYVKPHRAMFRKVLSELGVKAREAIHVGDNWLADVQGAKANGLWACHMTQWEPPERFEPCPGDHQPDLTITRLTQLPRALSLGVPAVT